MKKLSLLDVGNQQVTNNASPKRGTRSLALLPGGYPVEDSSHSKGISEQVHKFL